jgi:REP element-mobilizing transposase RayT
MSHSCVEVYLHVVFATKNRDSLIPAEMESRLHSYIGGIARKRNIDLIRINGMLDHLHLLFKLHPDVPIAVLLKEIKSYSSGWIKKQGFENFAWQNGYGAFSCSYGHLQQVIEYIERQKEHHQQHSLEEEINQINKKWGTTWMIQSP